MTTWIEISESAIRTNITAFQKCVGGTSVLAPPVKGNAYGHGTGVVARILEQAGCPWLSVATADDVRIVRNAGVTVPLLLIGYADGIDRKLSNVGAVLIRGQRAPIVGRVCMNLLMVDVTTISNVGVGDEVMIIGAQGDERITVEDIAVQTDTINYEVTTRLRENIPRIVV